ncbi:MAG: hypothetical protein HY423_10960 [Candidatus Lambdaproteobacteria bacterium]|nr:hypothetical protein [Candidatus Lambdaproteobacteria bacterium]
MSANPRPGLAADDPALVSIRIQRQALVGRLLPQITHEAGNGFSKIALAVELLLHRELAPEQRREKLRLLQRHADGAWAILSGWRAWVDGVGPGAFGNGGAGGALAQFLLPFTSLLGRSNVSLRSAAELAAVAPRDYAVIERQLGAGLAGLIEEGAPAPFTLTLTDAAPGILAVALAPDPVAMEAAAYLRRQAAHWGRAEGHGAATPALRNGALVVELGGERG